MKADELRRKSDKELQGQLRSYREDLRRMRFDLASGKIKNIRAIHSTKKDIARILTILRERQLEEDVVTERNNI